MAVLARGWPVHDRRVDRLRVPDDWHTRRVLPWGEASAAKGNRPRLRCPDWQIGCLPQAFGSVLGVDVLSAGWLRGGGVGTGPDSAGAGFTDSVDVECGTS